MSAYGVTLAVNSGQIPSAQGDFVWLFTQQNFIDANNEDAINGSANSILNGGGNLRCYTDDTKTTQLPIEIVTFVTGVFPQVQVWGLSPSLDTASTVYVEADDTEITQPPVTDTYGRNAVWKDFEAVIHASETGTDGVFVDSTGNNYDTTLTTGATLSTVSTGHPFNSTWPDFTGLEVITLTSSYQTINNTPFTLSCLVNIDVLSNVDGLFGNRYSTGDINWAQIQSNGRVFSRATGFSENRAEGVFPSVTSGIVKLKQNSSLLQSVFNSTVTAEDTTISGGESINNVNSANSFRVGGYFNNSESFRYNGRAAEFRIKREFDDADRDEAEENNILNSGAFWSTGAWEQQGGGLVIQPQSIPSEETFGTPTFTVDTPLVILPTGIPSEEVFGNAMVEIGTIPISPVGIPTEEIFGVVSITLGPTNISPVGIPTEEMFGNTVFTGGEVVTVSGNMVVQGMVEMLISPLIEDVVEVDINDNADNQWYI